MNYKDKILRRIMVDGNTCWIWRGSTSGLKKGVNYGRCTIGSRKDGTRRQISTHRLSYMAFKGSIPDGLFVCHSCDNGLCVNPDHLFLGTRQDNVDDRERKHRNNCVFGEKTGSHKLKERDVLEIRYLLSIGNTARGLARRYNVHHSTIQDIKNGITWKELPSPPEGVQG